METPIPAGLTSEQSIIIWGVLVLVLGVLVGLIVWLVKRKPHAVGVGDKLATTLVGSLDAALKEQTTELRAIRSANEGQRSDFALLTHHVSKQGDRISRIEGLHAQMAVQIDQMYRAWVYAQDPPESDTGVHDLHELMEQAKATAKAQRDYKRVSAEYEAARVTQPDLPRAPMRGR